MLSIPNRLRLLTPVPSVVLAVLTMMQLPQAGQRAQAQDTRRVLLHCSGQPSSDARPTYAYAYESVDVVPTFPGGNGAMMRFINSERRYPQKAYENAIEGRVLCSFVVEADGTLSHLNVLRGVEESLNNEALRIISQMPAWNPGLIDDEKVAVYCILPIPFRL